METAANHRIALAILALFAMLAFSAANACAQEESESPAVDVYLLSGQSNMAGTGQAAQLEGMWQQPVAGAYLYRGDAFETLVAGQDGTSGRFGPELGFAHYMRNNQPGKPKVYIIKFALSGQPLDAGWDGGAADGSSWVSAEPAPNRKTFYPGTGPEDPNIGLHYKKLHDQVTAGMNKLTGAGLTPRLRGVVWMQGEQDAKNQTSAGRYDKSLSLLKRRIEQDFSGGEDVPFVFGQILPHEPAMDRFTHRDLIRKRMAEADWRSDSERAIDNVWMVPTEGMELTQDTVHYSTAGLLELGQAFGVEMLKAHRKAEQDAKK